MTGAGVVRGVGVLGAGAGGIAAVVLSPVPLLVVGGVALLALGTVAVVVLTAALSCHPVRQPNAAAVLDGLIAAVTGNRRWAGTPTTPLPAPASARSPQTRRRRR